MKDRLTLKEIADMTCAVTGIDIRERTRKQQYFFGRMIYCTIAREHTFQTLEKIGAEVGIKHDTTIYTLRRFKEDVDTRNNKKMFNRVLFELDLDSTGIQEEKPTNLDLLQLSVFRDLKEFNYTQLSEFNETRLKPFKNALKSRVLPKVILEVAGARLLNN
jgi:hypothetical protein